MRHLNKIILASLFLFHTAHAQNLKNDFETILSRSLQAFQLGDYAHALRILNESPAQAQGDVKFLYWKANFQFKLQKFNESIPLFEQVIVLDQGRTFPSVWYQIGQCFYATQNFVKARQSFIDSARVGYKTGASQYYTGFTSQILGENDEALKHYQVVQSLPASEWEIKQPAAFQSAEIYFSWAKKITNNADKQKTLRKKVIPAFEWARDLDKKNALSAQADQRINDVLRLLGELAPRTRNKSLIPIKPWVVRISQNVKYDSNVINEPDNRIIKVSNRESPLSHSAIFGKYELIFWNWIAFGLVVAIAG